MRVIGRGRAIVRRLPSRQESRTFRPGDFVLTRTSGALAGMTSLATGVAQTIAHRLDAQPAVPRCPGALEC